MNNKQVTTKRYSFKNKYTTKQSTTDQKNMLQNFFYGNNLFFC